MTDLIDKFFSDKRFSAATKEGYRAQLVRFFSWADENDVAISSLTPADFSRYTSGHDWSVNSQYSALCAVRSYVRWCYGAFHPLLTMYIRRPMYKPQRTPNEEDIWKALAALDTSTATGVRNVAMITLMLDSGIRASEVCRLAVQDVDFAARSFRVLCKGNQWGFGSYSDYTASCLDGWMAVRKRLSLSSPVMFVCCKKDAQLDTSSLRRIFSRLSKRCGMKNGFSPHDLRRAFATLALKSGAPTRVVQVAGRWRSLRMVERYSQALESADILPFSPVKRIIEK